MRLKKATKIKDLDIRFSLNSISNMTRIAKTIASSDCDWVTNTILYISEVKSGIKNNKITIICQ